MTCARFGGAAAWFFRRRRDGEEGAGGVALQDRASLSWPLPAREPDWEQVDLGYDGFEAA